MLGSGTGPADSGEDDEDQLEDEGSEGDATNTAKRAARFDQL